MDFIFKRRNRLLLAIYIQVICSSNVFAWAEPIVPGLGSASDRLMALFRNDFFQSKMNEKSNSADPETLKKALNLLFNKMDDPNKSLSSPALQELMSTGMGKIPKPINLIKDDPAEAVIKYFQELGITEEECQKRTICELLTEPQAGYGVFGELLNYVFGEKQAPNIKKWMKEETFKELYNAADNGRRMNNCSTIYSKCPNSYKDYIKLVSA